MDNLPPIEQLWHKHKASKIKQYPQNNLRASSVGHPCDRYHFHALKDWREKGLHDPVLQSIFDEGNLHEKDVLHTLSEMGVEVIEQQRSFQLDNPKITGHIDGILLWEGRRIPFDIKSINPYDFQKINSAEDLLFSKKVYQRQYPAQLQLYLLMTNEEVGGFILKNKLTGEIKPIWMAIDYDYAEQILKRAERVYAALDHDTPPERTVDLDLCSKCPFAHICLPDLTLGEGVQLIDDMEMAAMLERRAQCEPLAKEYQKIDADIKDAVKPHGPGERLCGNYLIKTTQYERVTKVPITWDEETKPYLRTQILEIKS